MKKVAPFLLTMLLFSGCYLYISKALPLKRMVKLPNFSKAYQLQSYDSFPDPLVVSRVINIFYHHWALDFGDKNKKVFKALDSLMIEWKEEPKNGAGFSIIGHRVEGVIRGVAVTPGYIWVWKNKYNRISSTALIHELVHCALWSTNYHGDPDHEGPKYDGWTKRHTEFILKLNYLLAGMDI